MEPRIACVVYKPLKECLEMTLGVVCQRAPGDIRKKISHQTLRSSNLPPKNSKCFTRQDQGPCNDATEQVFAHIKFESTFRVFRVEEMKLVVDGPDSPWREIEV
jgi:hypothetical protein